MYVAWANAFILNGNVVYLNPVSASEFADIYRSVTTDDKLGVSIGSLSIIFGALPSQSEVAANLKMADIFLGEIVFGKRNLTKGYVFPPGYRINPVGGATGTFRRSMSVRAMRQMGSEPV